MRLLEHQSKKLLAGFGLTFSPAMVVASAAHAEKAASELGGPVVVKAQVPIGGRAKAGAVIFAEMPGEARDAATRLLSMSVRGWAVRHISVEPRINVAQEFYVAVAWDDATRLPVAILSKAGGVDVESSGREDLRRVTFDPFLGLRAFQARQLARRLGLSAGTMLGVSSALEKLAAAFLALDGVTMEINPLARTNDGSLVGLDAHVELDDDAMYRLARHLEQLGDIELGSAGRVPTHLEKEAQRVDAADHRGVAGRVVEFDGDLALLIGGGGASLTVFDAVKRYGGRPANYCEVGGNPTEAKVAALTALLLNKPGVRKLAVIMNVVNNTRADVMARGAIEGARLAGRVPRDVISVFRIPGSWEAEAKAVLAEAGIEALGREISLDAAAKLAVQSSRGGS
jgi:succinyl-CoA synthetase beta subunit/citryl-CoA synthetase large subunit